MRKVPSDKEQEMMFLDFVIYNHLFSDKSDTFTIKQLVEDLRQYDLDVSEEVVLDRVKAFNKRGLVSQNVGSFSLCVGQFNFTYTYLINTNYKSSKTLVLEDFSVISSCQAG